MLIRQLSVNSGMVWDKYENALRGGKCHIRKKRKYLHVQNYNKIYLHWWIKQTTLPTKWNYNVCLRLIHRAYGTGYHSWPYHYVEIVNLQNKIHICIHLSRVNRKDSRAGERERDSSTLVGKALLTWQICFCMDPDKPWFQTQTPQFGLLLCCSCMCHFGGTYFCSKLHLTKAKWTSITFHAKFFRKLAQR